MLPLLDLGESEAAERGSAGCLGLAARQRAADARREGGPKPAVKPAGKPAASVGIGAPGLTATAPAENRA